MDLEVDRYAPRVRRKFLIYCAGPTHPAAAWPQIVTWRSLVRRPPTLEWITARKYKGSFRVMGICKKCKIDARPPRRSAATIIWIDSTLSLSTDARPRDRSYVQMEGDAYRTHSRGGDADSIADQQQCESLFSACMSLFHSISYVPSLHKSLN